MKSAYRKKLLIQAPASIGTCDQDPVCIGDPASNGDPACIKTLPTCHIKLLCVYMIYLISNTNRNKHMFMYHFVETVGLRLLGILLPPGGHLPCIGDPA